MKTVLDRISERYESLTPSQRKAAEYLFDNLSEAILLSSTQISKSANVSEATLTRVINSLGFSSLPEFKREGKSYLTIAFGCTGGRHRSVVLANLLGDYLNEKGFRTNVSHRDIRKK